MLSATLIICVVLSIAIACLVLLKPLFLDKPSPYFQSRQDQSGFNPSISLLETIAELETDYTMGKISADDYEALSLEYKRDYLEQQKKQTS